MREAQKLNRLWAKGNRAKVLKTLTAGGSLNVRLLTLMLDAQTHAHKETLRLCHQWVSELA